MNRASCRGHGHEAAILAFGMADYDDDGGDDDAMVVPCLCHSTAKFVHFGCLRTWQVFLGDTLAHKPAAGV